jgi:GT2 family glycosyltransferase
MISVVCVYNNEKILRDGLLKGLKNQTVEFELITLENTDNKYKSAAEALNCGGTRAKGDYIMFVHQDMWLASDSWLEDAEETLKSIPDLGVAGVAGMSENGRKRRERVRFSIDIYEEGCWEESGRITEPEEVQTLDECLLIVPRSAFGDLQFDEKVFDGWDCYGTDYCLSVRQLGLRAYVIPGRCSHSCLRAHYYLWEFKGLLEFQERLYRKHKSDHRYIYTWMGDISWLRLRLRSIMGLIAPLYEKLFLYMSIHMRRELSGCETVLDLGCGPHSPIHRCNIPFSVGVELFEPSLVESKRKGIHSQYLRADIRQIEFRPKSFDAVIAVEVLEHLTKQEGTELLIKMERWARKKIIITTPNEYLWQGTYENNPLQEHKSGWDVKELSGLGFKVRGMAGWRRLRGHKASVKYKPPFLWARISDLTQKITYHYPKLAFQLLAIKRIDHDGNI